MRLYFVRHGETNFNLQNLLNDDPADNVILTENGVLQACEAAEALKHSAIARVFTSEMPRTRRTAEIINLHHLAPLTIDGRLNDRKTGFNGRPKLEYEAVVRADPPHVQPPGGESFQEEKSRIFQFLDQLLRLPPATTLVVAHGETLKVASGYFQPLSDQEMLALPIGNCQILVFDT